MRVLLAVHALPGDALGGTELYTRDLAAALARDHEVAVAAPTGTDVHVPGADVFTLPSGDDESGLSGVVCAEVDAAFADLLARVDPDVVHLQHLKALSAGIPALCDERDVPCLLTLHDFWTVCHREQLYRPEGYPCEGPTSVEKCTNCYAAAGESETPLRPFDEEEAVVADGAVPARPDAETAPGRFYRRAVARRAEQLADARAHTDLLVAPSRFLRDAFVAFGTPPDRIRQERNGIRTARFRDEGFDPDGPLDVAYAGRVTELKGVHLLVEAMWDVADARCHVFGSFDPAEDDYHARLAEAAGDDVRFHGRYDDPATPYATADVLVVPSLWYENSPLVIQEAFAAGVPVVAADAGGMAELVTDGEDGLLFDRSDADDLSAVLRKLADDPGRVADLRADVTAPRRLDDHADAVASLYREARS
ncbi:hypothetical protein DMJ13_10010 [halophilic archaeon]|nr:hypothetical protein DMJ13_10010 [halophilic archaeon]